MVIGFRGMIYMVWFRRMKPYLSEGEKMPISTDGLRPKSGWIPVKKPLQGCHIYKSRWCSLLQVRMGGWQCPYFPSLLIVTCGNIYCTTYFQSEFPAFINNIPVVPALRVGRVWHNRMRILQPLRLLPASQSSVSWHPWIVVYARFSTLRVEERHGRTLSMWKRPPQRPRFTFAEVSMNKLIPSSLASSRACSSVTVLSSVLSDLVPMRILLKYFGTYWSTSECHVWISAYRWLGSRMRF